MFTRKGFVCLYIIAQLLINNRVGAYKSGCSGEYCFVMSDNTNNELLDQSNAQERCRLNGTELVEITREDIQNSLVNTIRSIYSEGLNGWSVLTNGKRSSGNWIRLSGNNIGSLQVNEQTDASYAYGYVRSTTPGFDLFASRPADNKAGFICTGLSDCSGGVTLSGQCYKSFRETCSWYDARNRCQNEGGDLASFDYITTNAGFNAMTGSWIDRSNSYWIGIRRESWTWQIKNSDVKYSDWLTGHPIKFINDHSNTDCLCLSTSELKWIECGCTQQLPFVCMSETKASISTSTTTRTTTSIVTVSTSKATSATASQVGLVSEGLGVSTPTIPATMSTNSTLTGNNTEGKRQSMRLSKEATIGIGVGVGVGGALVILALVVAAIILCRKRCPLRCPERKKTSAKLQTPDILMTDSESTHHGIENPYAVVVSSPDITETAAYDNSTHTPIVYAPLEFATGLQSPRPGSVTIVPGRTNPVPVPSTPKHNATTDHFRVNGDLYAEVTKA